MGGGCSSPLNGRQRRYLRGKKRPRPSPLLFIIFFGGGGRDINPLGSELWQAPWVVSALLPRRKAASVGSVLAELTFGLCEA